MLQKLKYEKDTTSETKTQIKVRIYNKKRYMSDRFRKVEKRVKNVSLKFKKVKF